MKGGQRIFSGFTICWVCLWVFLSGARRGGFSYPSHTILEEDTGYEEDEGLGIGWAVVGVGSFTLLVNDG